MDEPPFSLAFVMVKESFVVPAILFYLASNANKNKHQDHLKSTNHDFTFKKSLYSTFSIFFLWGEKTRCALIATPNVDNANRRQKKGKSKTTSYV